MAKPLALDSVGQKPVKLLATELRHDHDKLVHHAANGRAVTLAFEFRSVADGSVVRSSHTMKSVPASPAMVRVPAAP